MKYPKSRHSNLVVQEFETEILIYDLAVNKAYCLNQTSALVYQLADGVKNAAEIGKLMSVRLKMPVSEDVVWFALDQLKEDNLLENNGAVEINFGGLSRRNVIKKIGLASMIALPLISSITAPQSVDAQSVSCVANGGRCSFNGSFTQGSCCTGLRCNNFSTCQSCIPSGMPYDICGTGCSFCNNSPTFPRKSICCNSGVATTDGSSCFCP